MDIRRRMRQLGALDASTLVAAAGTGTVALFAQQVSQGLPADLSGWLPLGINGILLGMIYQHQAKQSQQLERLTDALIALVPKQSKRKGKAAEANE